MKVTGVRAEGYLSGNGLLTAVAYGFLAGAVAAELAAERALQGNHRGQRDYAWQWLP